MSLRFDNKSLGRDHNKPPEDTAQRFYISKTKISIPRPNSQHKIQDGPQSSKYTSDERYLADQGLKRSNKISSLQQEFEQLKQKIKEVESKNEKIIEKIQTNKNFPRRSNVDEVEVCAVSDSSIQCMRESIEPFRTHNLPPHPLSFTYSNKKRLQNHSQAYRQSDESPRVPVLFKRKSYRQPVPLDYDSENLDGFQRHSMNGKPSSARNNMVGIGLQKSFKEEKLQQTDFLEQKLKKSQNRLEYIRENFKNYSECVKLIVQNQLDRFMESVIGRCLGDMDRKTRRNKERIDKISKVLQKYANIGKQNNFLSQLSEVASKKNNVSDDNGGEKGKHRELEGLVTKYELLIKAKNQESEGISMKLKNKQKELADMKMNIDRLKDGKRKVENQSQERMSKLETKITQLTDQNRKLTLDLEKNARLLRVGSTFTNEVLNKPIPEFSLVEELDKTNIQLNEAMIKISALEKSLGEKSRVVTGLQRQLVVGKIKKQELLEEYQQSLDRNRSAFKMKLDEHARTYQELRSQLARKDDFIIDLELKLKNLQQKEAETRIEVSGLQQRLELKEQLQKMRQGQYNSLLKQCEQKEKVSFSATSIQTVSRHNEELQSQIRQLKFQNDKISASRDSLSTQLRLLQQSHTQSQDQCRELRTKINTLTSQMRQQMSAIRRSKAQTDEQVNLLQLSEKQQQQLERKLLQQQQARQLKALQNQNSQLRTQNITVHSRIIELENELRLSNQLKQQQVVRGKQAKSKQQQLELANNLLKRQLESYERDAEVVKAKHKEELIGLDAELKLVEDQFNNTYRLLEAETGKVSQKTAEAKRLQEELFAARKAWSQMELLRADNEHLKLEYSKAQLKLTDLEDQLRKSSVSKSRTDQEHQNIAETMKQTIEKLTAQKVGFDEENKFLKGKIEELELQMFNEASEGDAESQSQMRNEGLLSKVKALEKASVEQQIVKANLQRHLRSSEQNMNLLQKKHAQKELEIERQRADFHKLMLSYDERIQQQDKIIRQLERCRDQHPSQQRLEQTKRSQLKSQSSLMFSANSQIFDKEIDFALSEVSDYAQPNVESLFEKDYPFDKLKLRRKDQVHLLQKTAEYIAKLKQTINDKNRKIRALEKRIGSLKASETLPKSFDDGDTDDLDQDLSDFNDNYSVKIQDRKGGHRRKLRQLQNQTHLVMEENHLLLQRVQNLQDELERAQQQQNGLIRMKEIYKEEISKLRKTLEQKQLSHTKEVMSLQKRIEQSESTHNLEAVRQLLTKIFSILFSQEKKQQRRKEVEEYVKVLASVLKMDNPMKERAWIWRR